MIVSQDAGDRCQGMDPFIPGQFPCQPDRGCRLEYVKNGGQRPGAQACGTHGIGAAGPPALHLADVPAVDQAYEQQPEGDRADQVGQEQGTGDDQLKREPE